MAKVYGDGVDMFREAFKLKNAMCDICKNESVKEKDGKMFCTKCNKELQRHEVVYIIR